MMLSHIRPKPHGIQRLQDFLKGRASIGWPCNQDLRGLNRDELKEALIKEYPDISNISISQVEQFLHIQKDSIILTPSEDNMHIFRTIDAPDYDANRDNNKEGNPHGISVEHVMTVKKLLLPSGVLTSLKGAQKTVCNLSKHVVAMDKFIEVADHISDETVTTEIELQEKVRNILILSLDSDNEIARVNAAVALYQPA